MKNWWSKQQILLQFGPKCWASSSLLEMASQIPKHVFQVGYAPGEPRNNQSSLKLTYLIFNRYSQKTQLEDLL